MKQKSNYRIKLMLVGIVVAAVLGGSSGSVWAEHIWTQKTDMPTSRWGNASAVVNGMIYVIGGASSQPGSVYFPTVEEYDPKTDTWTTKANMPTRRFGPSTCVLNGKIYVIGGDGGHTAVEEYDPTTDEWTIKADMSTGREYLATAAVGGKIYAIGGTPDNAGAFSIVEEYDPVTDTWTRKADMPMHLWGLCANVVRGKIYTLGGRPGLQAAPNVQEYDPATDIWTQKSDMPVATSQMDSVVLGDKIIVIGGWLWSANLPYRTVQIYDPETDIWTIESNAPFLRACFSADVVNNRIYVIGGTDRPHPCPATSTVYELVISVPQPQPDFNGDGIVDSADMCIVIDHWGENYSLCDIAPMPWGDSIVDVQDLVVLVEHMYGYRRPIAHWTLDEREGNTAYDKVGQSNASVYGGALWQPAEGMFGGALELNGIDDYIDTDFVLDLMEDSFSVFAWIKGGAPGQVVVSQQSVSNWLTVDTEGNLMTELKCTGRSAGSLLSKTVVTDGQWYRIGLVWDGSHRTLFVDGVAVAEDTPHGLEGSQMGLYIGTGKNYAPSTFFSGLIDDVRIYNQALSQMKSQP